MASAYLAAEIPQGRGKPPVLIIDIGKEVGFSVLGRESRTVRDQNRSRHYKADAEGSVPVHGI